MRSAIMITAVAGLLALQSCAHVLLVGPASAQLARDDIQQIKQAVRQRPDLRSGAIFIRPLSADRVSVQSGSSKVGETHWTFTMRRVGARWNVDESSIASNRIVVTH